MTKRGFTVVEMMFAVSIFALVVASLGAVSVGVRRMIGRAYAVAELSVRMRALREKILFHAVPTVNGRAYAGLLSGEPKSAYAVEGGTKVNVRARAYKLSDGSCVDQTIELVRDAGHFKNDGASDPWRSRWMRLGGMGAVGELGYLSGDAFLEDRTLGRGLYSINLRATLDGVTHAERIVVPVFGTEQQKNVHSVFHDDQLP